MISIHAPREGCDGRQIDFKIPSSISIHAPREGCDCEWVTRNGKIYQISIHAPREGCDTGDCIIKPYTDGFQSTHPARGATTSSCNWHMQTKKFQSTHPARGATVFSLSISSDKAISIHAPREGCDLIFSMSLIPIMHFNPRTPRGVRRSVFIFHLNVKAFQSTHPARGATGHL